jgi:RNA polymerase sigma-70 factor, ECF subfamily
MAVPGRPQPAHRRRPGGPVAACHDAAQPAEEGRDDTGLNRVLDRQLVTDALHQLSPANRTVLVETFYRGRTLAKVARQLRIPDSTARSRLHYALQALRRQLEDHETTQSR